MHLSQVQSKLITAKWSLVTCSRDGHSTAGCRL